jgi:hypothetical protein
MKHPFERKNIAALTVAILNEDPLPLPETTHKFMKDLVAKLLEKD